MPKLNLAATTGILDPGFEVNYNEAYRKKFRIVALGARFKKEGAG